MKPHVSPHWVVLMIGCMAPLHAQNLNDNLITSRSGERGAVALRTPAGEYHLPPAERVRGEVTDKPPVYVAQDAPSLKVKTTASGETASRKALEILRNPAPRRAMVSRTRGQRYEVASGSLQSGLQLVASMYRELGKPEAATDCGIIAMSVAHRIDEEPSRMLEFVEREVAANPNCSCEIVKAAIHATDAAPEKVAAIAETAILAAPESMRLISQCAIAASPGSLAAVQSVLARLDPNAGESGYGSKSAKSAKGPKAPLIEPPATVGNPLDFPVEPPYMPPPVDPPHITEVNPGNPGRGF